MTVKSRFVVPMTLFSTIVAGGCNNDLGQQSPGKQNTQRQASAPLNPGNQEDAKAASAAPKQEKIKIDPKDAKNFGPYDKEAITFLSDHIKDHQAVAIKEVVDALQAGIDSRKTAIGVSEGNPLKEFSKDEKTTLQKVIKEFDPGEDKDFALMKKYVESKNFTGESQVDIEMAVHIHAINSMQILNMKYKERMDLYEKAVTQKAEEKGVSKEEIWKQVEAKHGDGLRIIRTNIPTSSRFFQVFASQFKEWIGRNKDALKTAA